MSETPDRRASEFIQRHGFGAFIACVLLIELLGLNPYSPLRAVSALDKRLIQHEQSVQQTNAALDQSNATLRDIASQVREQTRVQTQAALIQCLRASKSDLQREECAKTFGGRP